MAQAEWDRLFDELYLRTYAPLEDEERTAAEVAGVLGLLGLERGMRVLDAPCGYGRHALRLAREGLDVTGIDRSRVLLAEAERRRGDADRPHYVQGDVRELPFPDGSFDVVLNLFTSVLGYHGEEDDVRFLAECRRVLRPGGRLVVETMHRDRLASVFRPETCRRVPDGLLFEEHGFDPVTGVNEVVHELWGREGEPVSLAYRIRVYTAGELVALLRRAAFAAVEAYGGLDGAPLAIDSRLVLVAS